MTVINIIRIGLGGLLISQFLAPAQSSAPPQAIAASSTVAVAPAPAASPVSAFDYLKARTVHITAGSGQRPSVGSGSILANNQILTCFHVVRGNEQAVRVRLGDEQTVMPATVVKTDRQMDLALLKVEPSQPLPAISLAPSPPTPSTPTFVMGSPFGQQNTLTQGVVEKVLGNGRTHIQVEIKSGNSGGPAALKVADGSLAQFGVVCGGLPETQDPATKAFRTGVAISLDVVKSFVGGV